MGNKLKSSGKYRTETLKFTNRIDNKSVWDALEHQPSDRVFSRCGVVKFVIDLTTNPENPTPYFLQSKIYTYHYEFVQDQLGIPVNLSAFNDEQYLFWPRRFMLGTIVNFKDQGLYAFELWPGDTMPPEGIVQCWKILSASIGPASPLRFRPCGAGHEKSLRDALASGKLDEAMARDMGALVNGAMVTNEELFKAVVYQPLTIGSAIGVIRLMTGINSDPNKLFSLNREDILVCDEVPNDLPPVRALVTAQLQTPLCHVALLCANRRAPNLAVRSALTDFAPYDGKLVKLSCNMLDYQVREATEDDQMEWLKTPQGLRATQPTQTIIPLKVDDSLKGIVTIAELKRSAQIQAVEHAIGAKAAQVAYLAKVNIPEHCFHVIRPSFVIPFHYYQQHVHATIPKLPDEEFPLQQLIVNSKTLATRTLASELGKIQEQLIESSHFDEKLLDDLMERLSEGLKPKGFLACAGGAIFRSSTNVEDLPGFNGAGLYLSEPVKTADLLNREVVAETIKRVWASVWTVRGFMERNEFGLDQSQVRMAILVMPYLDKTNVIANGVAITGNPFRNTFNAHFINAQVAGTAVTDNCAGTTPEQLLVYDDDTPTPEILSTSSLTNGQPILQSSEIIDVLFPTFKKLHKHFALKKKEADTGQAVDIEFLILNNPTRDLVLLQCRPCTITYQSAK
jgi:hypothetical protein